MPDLLAPDRDSPTRDRSGIVEVFAPAKLNLFLELHRRREDGYHELETVMVPVSRYDRLRLRATAEPTIRLDCRWSPSVQLWHNRLPTLDPQALDLPRPEENLVYRALERFRTRLGVEHGYEAVLEKTIPAGAGMGGGSSDAAAALLAAAELLITSSPPGGNRPRRGAAPGQRRDLPPLAEIAAELGSDVPFFLGALGPGGSQPGGAAGRLRAALATGRGERLRSVPLRGAQHWVIVSPPQALATAAVYGAGRVPAAPKSARNLLRAMAAGDSSGMHNSFFNRLTEPARSLCPGIDRVLNAMRQVGLPGGQMTGSGSACFALAPSAELARRAAAKLDALGVGLTMTPRTIAVPPATQITD